MEDLSDDEFEVDRILDEKKERGKRFFLIRWVGYDSKYDTWEPEDNLNCDEKIAKFYKELEEFKSEESEYEKKRKKMIARNEEMLKKLGFIFTIQDIEKEISPRTTKTTKTKKRKLHSTPPQNTLPRRRTRLQSRSKVETNEGTFFPEEDMELQELPEGLALEDFIIEDKRKNKSQRGKLNQMMFKTGGRIYDSVNGVTCHQCRQKTIDPKSHCINENSVDAPGKHRFCEMCLKTRYGEELDEVLKNPNYACPFCRDLCNCSFCRQKAGKAATGILYNVAISLGYKSAADYLAHRKD